MFGDMNLLFFFFNTTQGLIFVVDSNDRERINEARDELSKMVCSVMLKLLEYYSTL